ncbi:GntR family transcriptional regulator [Microbacterium caowuchunii]|uniref:GntR family transcriptional regulator n=1 Tax=Microbacterium caowuchunii TaxID=2614638 RepID=A0A5N0TGE9_9MICO|nr:GntR family transcriptional regulator [Microbacterium caowuchunii]KAA9132359.1 GntR family transcriptional regulator [Microbacterium caowuchunii]
MSSLDLGPVRDRRPLAVQVYDRLYEALVIPGRMGPEVPTEVELAERLGVSRTTVRQALALLEEDGILARGAGRRRIVAPRHGPELNNPPLEDMLTGGGAPVVEAVARRVQLPTRWGSSLLRVSQRTEVVCWESVLRMDGAVVASALEFTTAEWASTLEDRPRVTMLAALGGGFRGRARQSLCRLSLHPTSAGTRGPFDAEPRADRPDIVLTQVLETQGAPAYLAKHVVRLGAVTLTLAGPQGDEV